MEGDNDGINPKRFALPTLMEMLFERKIIVISHIVL